MCDDRLIRGTVELAVMCGAGHSDVVDVGEIGFLCAQFNCGNPENAAPASHVDTDGIGGDVVLHELHAHGSRLVLSRSESHIRIEQNDFFPFRRSISYPFGHDYDFSEMNGAEVLFPYVYPVVSVHFAFGVLQRSEGNTPAAAFLGGKNIPHDVRTDFFRDIDGDITFYQYVARLLFRQFVVHIIPIHGIFALLKGNNVVDVTDRHAVICIIPHDVGHDFAGFRRRMHGQFCKFHEKPLYVSIYIISLTFVFFNPSEEK